MFPSERLALAEAYAASLATVGVVRGLIGPREVPRLWSRHLVNCALLAPLIPPGADVCDVGSGAGLPGLVLAIVRPDVSVTLVEPLLRRTTYLSEIAVAMGLENVEVVRGRAESLHGIRRFDVVTSRAVAPLPRLLDWSMPLVHPRGELVAMKGSQVFEEVRAAEADLARWRCAAPVIEELVPPAGASGQGSGGGEEAGASRVVGDAEERVGEGGTQGADVTYALRVSWSDPDSVRSTDASARGSRSSATKVTRGAQRGAQRVSRRKSGRR